MPKVTHESRLLLIPEFIEGLKNPDTTYYELADKYGVSYTTVYNFAHKYDLTCGRVAGGTKRTIKPEGVEQIKKLTLDGLSVGDICKRLDIAPATVIRYRGLLGLSKAYKKRRQDYKRDYNNADEKNVPCSRITLIRAANFSSKRGTSLKDLVNAAINSYIDSQSL